MKKRVRALWIASLVFVLAACARTAGTATSTLSSNPAVSATGSPAVVRFADPVLEAMIRGAMGRPEGNITVAEVEAVTRLDLNMELQQFIPDEEKIRDISGLEYFTNLESLDLSFQAISDISPLKGLVKLTLLSLGGNPIEDLAPLAGMKNLKALNLANCAARDYSPLAQLTGLEYLKLDNSTIADVSPIAALTNLRSLFLANSQVGDLSPLAGIYPNLANKDFTIATTLQELGFSRDDASHQAFFEGENASFTINHIAWGNPPNEWEVNAIQVSRYLEGDYKFSTRYVGSTRTYVIQLYKTEMLLKYSYDKAKGEFFFGVGDQQSSEQVIRAAMNVLEGEDALLAPVRIFEETIKSTFNRTADALYALPFEPPTLKNLGFFPDMANAVWMFEQRGAKDVNIELHRPEWGQKDYDFRFFTPLSAEYRINVTYFSGEKRFEVGLDDNSGGGAVFDYFMDKNEYMDGWSSRADKSVENYFIQAYNDPSITDIHSHSIELVRAYIRDTFGMTFEELFALPTGE